MLVANLVCCAVAKHSVDRRPSNAQRYSFDFVFSFCSVSFCCVLVFLLFVFCVLLFLFLVFCFLFAFSARLCLAFTGYVTSHIVAREVTRISPCALVGVSTVQCVTTGCSFCS